MGPNNTKTPTPTTGSAPTPTPPSAPVSPAPFSGQAPITSPLASQNSIPSSATGDIILHSDHTPASSGPNKKLLIALVAGILLAVAAIVAVLIVPKKTSQDNNVNITENATTVTDISEEERDQQDQEIAIELYDHMDDFTEKFTQTYIKSPEDAEALIVSELEPAIQIYDNDAVNLVAAISHYYQLNTERMRILDENGCLTSTKIDASCVRSIKSDPESEAGLTDTETHMKDLMEKIKEYYKKIQNNNSGDKNEN